LRFWFAGRDGLERRNVDGIACMRLHAPAHFSPRDLSAICARGEKDFPSVMFIDGIINVEASACSRPPKASLACNELECPTGKIGKR